MARTRFVIGMMVAVALAASCGESDERPDSAASGGSAGASSGGAGGASSTGAGGKGGATGGASDGGTSSGAVGGRGGTSDAGAPGSTTGSGGGGEGGDVGGGEAGAGGAGEEAACGETGGLSPEELLANIDTFVVLVMEARSFDHYLGSLQLEGKAVDGLTGSETNPDPDEMDVAVHELTSIVGSVPPEAWDKQHQAWNQGNNDGFVKAAAGPDQEDVMGYYTRASLPVTYALADGAVVCDRWFSSALAPTWPNRFYIHGATSKGVQTNTSVIGFESIFDVLNDAGISSLNYYSDVAWCTGGYTKLTGLATMDTFFEDAAGGTLPSFTLLDPQFIGNEANDDHPGHSIELGQALVATVLAALGASPQWSSSLFVLTYSNAGGFFDHVPPPTTTDEDPDFQQLGFRVPAIIAGPFVKPGCVLSTTLEHVSIIKTLSVRYGLASMNGRVDATADLSAAIHAPYLDDPQPPPVLPPVPLVIGAEELAAKPALAKLVEHGVRLGSIQASVIEN